MPKQTSSRGQVENDAIREEAMAIVGRVAGQMTLVVVVQDIESWNCVHLNGVIE